MTQKIFGHWLWLAPFLLCRHDIRQLLHTALPQYLSAQLERLQKQALRIIGTNDLSYRHTLEISNIPTLYERREANLSKEK